MSNREEDRLSSTGQPALTVVVPVYNEVENVSALLAEITTALGDIEYSYEIILVDDGSTDGSMQALREEATKDDRLRVFRFPRNQGQSAALAVGMENARGEIVVTIDADLQNDPGDIPRLVEALSGCDVVSGVRADRQDSWLRRVSSRVANRARNAVLHDAVSDVGCSLKAYRTEFLRRIPPFNGMHRFLPALARLDGARVREIDVNHRPRRHGDSKYGVHNRLWRGIRDLLGVRWLQQRWVTLNEATELYADSATPSEPTRDKDRPS